ncbi:polysaccharide deacetylase family protein [Streptomyces syringium]|uniref:polysaccharide deacetylase family protein n=1 Tax=Streptomyces syringium TaxID=76729 RepID=UPI0037D686E9
MNRLATAAARILTALSATVFLVVGPVGAPRGEAPPPHADSAGPGPVRSLFGREIRRMPTTRPVVALTFNAAWDGAGVDTVLTTLRRRHAPATFFLTGQFAERHPAAARAMAAEHGIGNHSYSHPQFGGLTHREVVEEVTLADRAIREATGTVPLPFFRFPYSATTPRGIAEVNALGFADIEFTVDTNGYLGRAGGMTVRKAVDRALAGLTPGEIVQLHVGSADGHEPVLDARALPWIIDAVRARGFEIVDLRALLVRRGAR